MRNKHTIKSQYTTAQNEDANYVNETITLN